MFNSKQNMTETESGFRILDPTTCKYADSNSHIFFTSIHYSRSHLNIQESYPSIHQLLRNKVVVKLNSLRLWRRQSPLHRIIITAFSTVLFQFLYANATPAECGCSIAGRWNRFHGS